LSMFRLPGARLRKSAPRSSSTTAASHENGRGLCSLDPDRPPADVPPKRWQRFVDDVGMFIDSPFCAVAASLGWGPHDLFGCARIGHSPALIDAA